MSNSEIIVRLEPLGKSIRVPYGTPLKDILFQYGVEFPLVLGFLHIHLVVYLNRGCQLFWTDYIEQKQREGS